MTPPDGWKQMGCLCGLGSAIVLAELRQGPSAATVHCPDRLRYRKEVPRRKG